MGDCSRPDIALGHDLIFTLMGQRALPSGLLVFLCLVCVGGACTESDGGFATPRANSELSAFQRELLGDGELTYGEMEYAAENYATCVARQGVRAEVEYDEQSRSFGYRVYSDTGEVLEVMESKETRLCEQEFISEVELFWADQVGPSQAEDQAFYGEVAACMRDRGFDVADSRPSTLAYWIDAEPREYDSCFDEVLEKQG